MTLTIHSTSKIVHLDGTPMRLWEGVTETGVPVHCFIARVAIPADSTPDQRRDFENDLKECRAPTPEIQAIPFRLLA